MKVAAYIRSDPDDAFSLKKQMSQITHFCQASDLEIVKFYSDAHEPVAGLSAPELHRLIEDARRRNFDAVVVTSVDRLTDDQQEFWKILKKLSDVAGISVISATEPFDTSSPMGKAAIESLKVVARLGRQGKLKEGKPPLPAKPSLPAETPKDLPAVESGLPVLFHGTMQAIERSLRRIRLNLVLIFVIAVIVAASLTIAGTYFYRHLSRQMTDFEGTATESMASVAEAVDSTKVSIEQVGTKLEEAITATTSSVKELYASHASTLDGRLTSQRTELEQHLQGLRALVERIQLSAITSPPPVETSRGSLPGTRFGTAAEYFRALISEFPPNVGELSRPRLSASCRTFYEERAVAKFYGEVDVLYDVPAPGRAVVIEDYEALRFYETDSYPDPEFVVFAVRAKSRLASPFRPRYRENIARICESLSVEVPAEEELYGRMPILEDNYVAFKQHLVSSEAGVNPSEVSVFEAHYEPANFGFVLIIDKLVLHGGRTLAVTDPEIDWLTSEDPPPLSITATEAEATRRGK